MRSYSRRHYGLDHPDFYDRDLKLDPATTPVYEGDAPMKFDFLKDMRKGDPLTLSAYSLGAHSGTHIDAPMHFVRDGASIEQLSLASLIGPARVIDIPDSVRSINAAELNRHEWRGAPRVIFRTRSSVRGWMASSTFHRDFAYIAPDAAQLLADAGFTGQDRVVLAAPRQNVHYLANFEIAAQHGVDLPRFRTLREINGVLIQIGRLAASGSRPSVPLRRRRLELALWQIMVPVATTRSTSAGTWMCGTGRVTREV